MKQVNIKKKIEKVSKSPKKVTYWKPNEINPFTTNIVNRNLM